MNKADGKIRIELVGLQGDEDSLNLDDFVDFLQTIKTGLHHTEHVALKNPATTVQFHITDLSHNTPFKVTMEPFGKNPNILDLAQNVVATFIGTITSIEQEAEVAYLDEPTLDVVKKIGKRRIESFSSILIGNCDSSISISDSLEKKTVKLMAIERDFVGTVSGMLDTLSVHDNANKFAVYPQTGGGRIDCKFPPEMFEMAKEGLGRYVKVRGKLKYKGNSKFPSRVTVQELVVMPKEETLPSFKTLFGTVPDITDGKGAADFIRSLREEDEE